jgi:hypothetical protein
VPHQYGRDGASKNFLLCIFKKNKPNQHGWEKSLIPTNVLKDFNLLSDDNSTKFHF